VSAFFASGAAFVVAFEFFAAAVVVTVFAKAQASTAKAKAKKLF